jgi:PAS domain S-box-containing protein
MALMRSSKQSRLTPLASSIVNMSLRSQVAITASFVFVLFVVALSYVSVHHFEQEFKNAIYRQQSLLVTALTNNIDEKLRMSHGALIASASKLDDDILTDPERAQRFLDEARALHSIFDSGLAIIDKTGRLVAESPFRPGRRGRDFSAREYVQTPLITDKPVISKPYASVREGHEPALRMTAPMMDAQGKVAGVLTGRINLLGQNLLARIADTKNGVNGYVFMTDQDGVMILHPDRQRLLTNTVGVNPLYDRAYRGFEGTGETVNSYGNAMIITFKRVKTTGWIFASSYPQEEANAPFDNALHFVLLALGIGTLLLAIILSALMRRLTSPLTRFIQHVETLPMKVGSARIFDKDASGEIGILVGAFNRMIGTLEQQQSVLQENESRLRCMIDGSPVGVFEVDIEGNCIFVNDRWCEIAGIDSSAANGDGWYKVLHPNDVSRVWGEWSEAARQGVAFRSSYRFLHADGSSRWVLGQASAIFNEAGALIAYVGTNTDITEQKLAEEEIQRLASIVRHSPDFIGICDMTGLPTFLNEAGRTLVGIRDDAHFHETKLVDYIPESEREILADEIIPAALRSGHWAGEIQFRHLRTGQAIPVWCDLFRIDDPVNGNPINFATVTRDITERKRLDRELHQHREQLEELVQERTAELQEAQHIGHIGNWHWQIESGQLSWSDEIYHIFGFKPGQFNATYQTLIQSRHPDDMTRIQQSEQAAFAEGGRHSIDYRIILPDGRVRWVHEEAIAVLDQEGRPRSMSGTIQDITERKQVERDLIESREAAEAASRAKSLFLSSMSHELRTPLNAVLGFAQLLCMDEEASEEVRTSAGEIENAGRHLLDLVSDILDLARIESGRVDLSIEDIDPSEILENCRILLDAQAKAHGITLDLSTPLLLLRADRTRLRQVFLNLLSNAVKYNREGGRVSVRGQLRPEGFYRISFKDSGYGIQAERLGELFQPFNRVGAERGSIEGTGIGLVITKTLVQAMGGCIGVTSVFGQGSTFWVDLPLASQQAGGELAAATAPMRQCAILAAEDHEPNRKLLRRQITKLGYDVEFACDGSEALQKWQAGHYHLLLTDCNMPVMDGYELAQAIRAREAVTGQRIAIVALTANTVKDAATACMAAGMDDFLVKPVQLQELQQVLTKWLTGVAPRAAPLAVSMPGHVGTVPVSVPVPIPASEPRPAYADYLETLSAMLGDDDLEEAGRMLFGFLASARECLRDAKTAVAGRDSVGFVRAMHKLKSSARMIGATALSDLCQRAEQAGQHQEWAAIEAELPSLTASLRETEERIQALPHQASGPGGVVTAFDSELAALRVMVVDDDPFILNYLNRILISRGVKSVRHAGEGNAALRELKAQAGQIDVVVCDLNMPGMDGVEFLRHLAESRFSGAVIIISGTADLLPTIYELAQAHGLRILGTLAKPFTPQRFFDILGLQLGARRSARPRSSQPLLGPSDVAEGLMRGEFIPYFQPKVDALTLKPYGAEALARWQRADGSIVSPFAFIPLMEVHGLIDTLFVTMLEQTLASATKLRAQGYGDLKLAVNLAASTLSTLNLPETIDRELQRHAIAPESLIVEITESGLMHDARIGLDVLLRLRLKGIGLSIDDFGTGYSTINQLRRLPFTELKIDQSFVASATKNPASRIILESSIEMARRLNLRTVAEGVETEQDLELIRSLGCDVVQGFLVAKPMPLEEFIVWMAQHGAGTGR